MDAVMATSAEASSAMTGTQRRAMDAEVRAHLKRLVGMASSNTASSATTKTATSAMDVTGQRAKPYHCSGAVMDTHAVLNNLMIIQTAIPATAATARAVPL
jgi:hypothetical protein